MSPSSTGGNDTSRIVASSCWRFASSMRLSTPSTPGVLETVARLFALPVASQEVLVSILVISCFFGAVGAGPLTARAGRRPTLILAAALALLGYATVLTTPGYGLLLVARVALGVSVGLSSMAVPMYAAEAAPARHRGAIVALFQLAITAGILFAYTVSLVFIESWRWSWILGAGIVPTVLVTFALSSLPESPGWLALRGRHEEAEAAAARLRLGTDWHEKSQAQPERIAPSRGNSTRAVLALCGGLFILQNLSGIDGILYYAPHIFQNLGFEAGTAALAATFGLGFVNFVATLCALRFVDSAGRRPLLIGGSVFMVLGLAMVAGASAFGWPWAGLAGLGLLIMAFAVSLGPLPYVLMSELFPSAIREAGIAMASAISWLFNALIAFTFLTIVESIGLTLTMVCFMAVCLLSLLVSLLYLPETRRVPLEVIEAKVMAGERLRWLGAAPTD